MQSLYTMVFREHAGVWVVLCLENGLVGQGASKEDASRKLQEAIGSFEEVRKGEEDIYAAPISIRELHEFLTYDTNQPAAGRYELCAMYA